MNFREFLREERSKAKKDKGLSIEYTNTEEDVAKAKENAPKYNVGVKFTDNKSNFIMKMTGTDADIKKFLVSLGMAKSDVENWYGL